MRPHAVLLKGLTGAPILKPQFAAAGAVPRDYAASGKSGYQTDAAEKPWMVVAFRKV